MAADLNAVLNAAVTVNGWPATSSASSATATAMVAGPSRGNIAHCVTGYIVGWQGGAVSGTPLITLTDGAKIIESVPVTSSSTNPIIHEYAKSIVFAPGNSATLAVTGLGAGMTAWITLHGHTLNA